MWWNWGSGPLSTIFHGHVPITKSGEGNMGATIMLLWIVLRMWVWTACICIVWVVSTNGDFWALSQNYWIRISCNTAFKSHLKYVLQVISKHTQFKNPSIIL